MGRFIKNNEIKTGSYSVRAPMGSNTVGPDVPVNGLFRFNTDTGALEYFSTNSWQQIQAGHALRELSKDTFYGNGVDRFFGPMRYVYNPGQEILLLVFIGNVFQNPGVAYRVNNDIIEFTSPPPEGQTVVILHGLAR